MRVVCMRKKPPKILENFTFYRNQSRYRLLLILDFNNYSNFQPFHVSRSFKILSYTPPIVAEWWKRMFRGWSPMRYYLKCDASSLVQANHITRHLDSTTTRCSYQKHHFWYLGVCERANRCSMKNLGVRKCKTKY